MVKKVKLTQNFTVKRTENSTIIQVMRRLDGCLVSIAAGVISFIGFSLAASKGEGIILGIVIILVLAIFILVKGYIKKQKKITIDKEGITAGNRQYSFEYISRIQFGNRAEGNGIFILYGTKSELFCGGFATIEEAEAIYKLIVDACAEYGHPFK